MMPPDHTPAPPPAPRADAHGDAFDRLDADFIRVVEDLIDVLIQKGMLRITDLPPGAQRKLTARKDLRGRMRGSLDLLEGQDSQI